jgi:hypothetical protein
VDGGDDLLGIDALKVDRRLSSAWRITAMISSTVGGSAG